MKGGKEEEKEGGEYWKGRSGLSEGRSRREK